MNISFNTIFPKKKSVSLRAFRLIYPEREWFLGLMCACIVFGVCAAYASIVFFQSAKRVDEGIMVVEDTRGVVYNKKSVSRVLLEYSERAERFNALTKDAPTVVPTVNATTSVVQSAVQEKEATSTPELQTRELQVE